MAGAHLSRKYGPPPDPPGGAGGAGGPGGPDHWKKPKWAGYVRPYSAVEKGAIAPVALAVVTYVSMSVTYSNRIGRMPWAWAGDDVPGFNAYAWERVVYVTELVWPTPPKKSGPAPGAVPFDRRLRPGAAAAGGAPGGARGARRVAAAPGRSRGSNGTAPGAGPDFFGGVGQTSSVT